MTIKPKNIDMEILLKRIAKRETYTVGHLYIDGKYFCDTLEDKDRGLSQARTLAWNKQHKIAGKTAIPTGRYRVTLGVQSPKYKNRAQYAFCNGYVPRLLNVPAYDGVLIHIGNYARDTEGCILVGKNTQVGAVMESTATFHKLYDIMKKADGLIFITII